MMSGLAARSGISPSIARISGVMPILAFGSVLLALLVVGLACGTEEPAKPTATSSPSPVASTSSSKAVTFDELFADTDQFNGKDTVLTGFYFHGFETIVLSERMEYSGFAEGHMWPRGRMIWIESTVIPTEIYDQLHEQQMMGPLERYGKLRIRGRFEHGGQYGHGGGFADQIVVSDAELLPWSPEPQPLDYPISELKYRLIDHFGGVLIGDPVMAPDDFRREQALNAFATIQQNDEEFQAILGRLGLSETAGLTEEQRVLVFDEKKKLNAVLIEPVEGGYSFGLIVREEGDPVEIKGTINSNGEIAVQARENARLPR